MKTQKLTLAAVLATTLLSTSAFAADLVIQGGNNTAAINLSLTIEKQCTIHGLNDTTTNVVFDATQGTAEIRNLYADCNSSTVPKIKFSSQNGAHASTPDFELVKGSIKQPYSIALDGNAVGVDTDIDLPTGVGKTLVFTLTAIPQAAGLYQDTLTATITL